jgi:transcriptional regulator with XRE-family HTH domain
MSPMTRLKAERRRRRWTQTALAFMAGLAPGNISQWERRRQLPNPRQLERLGQALGLPPETLLDEVQEEPRSWSHA